jgi:TonB family protein
MRFCPTCQTRYDEEILRFCTKDGTPLLEENQPNFKELPSESADDDADEVTVIRRNTSKPIVQSPQVANVESNPQPRIVIPTTQVVKEQGARARTTASYRQPPPPREANTGKIVLLTVLGTLIVLMGGGIAYLFLSRESSDDANENRIINANFNSIGTNLNANLNGNSLSNFNFNANANTNLNANTNVNTNLNTKTNANSIKTPTPTPKSTATPNDNANTNSNSINSNSVTPTPAVTRPSVTRPSVPPPLPSATPIPSPPAPPSNRPVNAGVLNSRAANLPKPAYPPIAKQMRASGQVAVQVFVDETGNVTAAKATSGNSLLRAPAEAAARQSRINPIIVGDRAVKAMGILVYNFID